MTKDKTFVEFPTQHGPCLIDLDSIKAIRPIGSEECLVTFGDEATVTITISSVEAIHLLGQAERWVGSK